MLSHETTYAPPGDENTVSRFDSTSFVTKQLTPPSGGRKIQRAGNSRHNAQKQLTPRQGTKTLSAKHSPPSAAETNQAPPGDENYKPRYLISSITGNNSHPVRGRKSFDGRHVSEHFPKQLTPRQGTKTQLVYESFLMSSETTYTPPGDENVSLLCSLPLLYLETTYAPSGDENLTGDVPAGLADEITYTPPGDENQTFATKHHVICFETTYTPPGDEKKQSSVKVIFTSEK